jgi:hypothetical protein
MEHKIDRLSELPEPVVEHILSFIPLKKILQLSTLSKRWQKVWTLFPIPQFNSKFYESNLYEISGNEKKQKITMKSEEFNYFVERTLVSRCRQKLRINKFNLKIWIMDELDYVVANRWIGYAIESNVKELNLGLKSYAYSSQKKLDEYQVPESILRAKSIILLKLSASNLKSKSSYNDINLSSLRKLILSQVDMDDQIFSSLIYGCPVLEEIEIAQCYGLKNIHLPACLPKLMAIALLYDCNGLESFEVEAPNLKKLVLNSPIVTDKWLHSVLSKHPLIESLVLKFCDMLERIKISSDRMKSLIICQCSYLVEVNIVTPNLHRLGYSGDVIPFSPNDFTLLEVSLHFSRKTSLDVETIEFLAKLGHPKLLSMTCSGCGKVLYFLLFDSPIVYFVHQLLSFVIKI